jgi:eukaryotic-like serine/threonine-protein kinase
MADASLHVTEGKEKGRWIPLDLPSVVIGRGDEADFTIDDDRASRCHLRITSKDDVWTIEDLGASNGTFVDGKRLKSAQRLSHGAEVRLGRTVLTFEITVKPHAPGVEGLTGRTIAGYQLLEQIGRGVGGVVYRARQASLEREVAVKLLTPKLSLDPAFVRRFFDEARAASSLSHPHVVRVYDGGRDKGYHFFAMELMRGGSVGDLLMRLPRGRLDVEPALRMILDAARGLEFAEQSRIIHRDVKPDNLMLTEAHLVKIGDLGIAIHADDVSAARMGTPQFLAPEVIAGLRASAASDIYGLGASLYQMLSGRTPYPPAPAAETLRLARERPPQALGMVMPALPRNVLALVAKLMARQPGDRPQSARDVVSMIEKTM